jgi:hypothetical protein
MIVKGVIISIYEFQSGYVRSVHIRKGRYTGLGEGESSLIFYEVQPVRHQHEILLQLMVSDSIRDYRGFNQRLDIINS